MYKAANLTQNVLFKTLYKSQVKELKEEIEEKIQKIEELKQELRNLQEDRYFIIFASLSNPGKWH